VIHPAPFFIPSFRYFGGYGLKVTDILKDGDLSMTGF
jgi:hypothetical protein